MSDIHPPSTTSRLYLGVVDEECYLPVTLTWYGIDEGQVVFLSDIFSEMECLLTLSTAYDLAEGSELLDLKVRMFTARQPTLLPLLE